MVIDTPEMNLTEEFPDILKVLPIRVSIIQGVRLITHLFCIVFTKRYKSSPRSAQPTRASEKLCSPDNRPHKGGGR